MLDMTLKLEQTNLQLKNQSHLALVKYHRLNQNFQSTIWFGFL